MGLELPKRWDFSLSAPVPGSTLTVMKQPGVGRHDKGRRGHALVIKPEDNGLRLDSGKGRQYRCRLIVNRLLTVSDKEGKQTCTNQQACDDRYYLSDSFPFAPEQDSTAIAKQGYILFSFAMISSSIVPTLSVSCKS
jgi:hypothetical protein